MSPHTESLCDRLKTILENGSYFDKAFLPSNVLDELVTEESVRNLQSWKDRWCRPDIPATVVKEAKRVFVILVLIGQAGAIGNVLNDGVTDKDLPLALEKRAGNGKMLKSAQGHEIVSLAGWKFDAEVDHFMEKQWLVLAPVLHTKGQKFLLDGKYPLPFTKKERVGGGHQSIVYRSTLPVAQQQNGTSDIQIAVKDFLETARDFSLELRNLDRIRALDNPHIIRYLASFEHGTDYYMVFPSAEGDLGDFWARQPAAAAAAETVLWSLQQLRGMAGALRDLHEGNFRHGDLKPENILYFDGAGGGRLVIADVGVSRVHDMSTMLRQDPTTTRATTPSYEAPEMHTHPGEPRSRIYDIWSLGCVYLEFVVWLLYGADAIESFRNARGHDVTYMWFFVLRLGNVRDRDAEDHPVVAEVMEALRQDPRCQGTAMGDVVDLVAEHLLRINVRERIQARELHRRLDKIVQTSESNPAYCFKQVHPLPELPPALRHTPSNGKITREFTTSDGMDERDP